MWQQPSPEPTAAPGTERLTDSLLRGWLRCRRRAWLDRHGPSASRRWTAHRALALHEQQLRFLQWMPERPGHGMEACQAGAATVIGVRLRGQTPQGLALEAHPPLLQRVESPSRWGDHGYRPVLVRQGRRTTREHRLLLALWARLLAQAQAAPVPQGLVLAGEGGRLLRERVAISHALDGQLGESLSRMVTDLRRTAPPPLVNDRKKCALCGWKTLCDQEASRGGHLSEVSGVGSKRRDLLLQAGVHSLSDLAWVDPERLATALAPHGDQHRDMVPELVAQARVQALGRPERVLEGDGLPELRGAPGLLIYDIESDPDAAENFLHGFLMVPCPEDGIWPPGLPGASFPGRYHPLLSLTEHGEQRLWQRLSTLLARHPGWPVLHYGETERVQLLRLAERQGMREADRAALRQRLVDVHGRLRRHWRLPVNSYGLRAVASWLGFAWSQPGAEGARCLLWWRMWRHWHVPGSPRRSALRAERGRRQLARIFRYNRDDGLATWAVAQWLLANSGDSGSAPEA
ncbi:MAG: TM0106 family RecB-like putative nuclease [Cyanobacteriota bacterium]